MSADQTPSGPREPRYDLAIDAAALRMSIGRATKVHLRNLSRSGFQTEWPYKLEKGDRIWLKIEGVHSLPALVAWNDNFMIGCRFEVPLHEAVLQRILAQAGGKPVA